MHDQPIPRGLCQCGCGEKTKLAPQSATRNGLVKGEPYRYVTNHHRRARRPDRSGICECGCGETTPLGTHTNVTQGIYKGHPLRFVHDHHTRLLRKPIRYEVRDCGYETPCWIWQLYTTSLGYGHASRNGKYLGAHWVYWEERHGPVPDGLELDHLCRQPSCVNPDHLEAVTHAENLRRGDGAKLTYREARDIRERARMHPGKGPRTLSNTAALASEYGVTRSTIISIARGDSWQEAPL